VPRGVPALVRPPLPIVALNVYGMVDPFVETQPCDGNLTVDMEQVRWTMTVTTDLRPKPGRPRELPCRDNRLRILTVLSLAQSESGEIAQRQAGFREPHGELVS